MASITLFSLSELFREVKRKPAFENCQSRLFDIVGHPDKFGLHLAGSYFNQCNTGPYIAVLWPTHTSCVDKDLAAHVFSVRFVRVAVNQNVGIYFFRHLLEELLGPVFVPVEIVLFWTSMKDDDLLAIN